MNMTTTTVWIKQTAFVVLVTGFLIGNCFAQQTSPIVSVKDQLHGTWFIDIKSSSQVPFRENSYWVISINGKEIKISKHLVLRSKQAQYDLILRDDKSGESNRVPNFATEEIIEINSKTYWNKNKLIRKYINTTKPAMFSISITEEYRLSKDGKKLTVDSKAISDFPLPAVGSALPHRLVFIRRD